METQEINLSSSAIGSDSEEKTSEGEGGEGTYAASLNPKYTTTNQINIQPQRLKIVNICETETNIDDDEISLSNIEDDDELSLYDRDHTTLALEYRELSLSKEGRQTLIELNAVPKLVLLIRNGENEEVKLNALRALFNLSVVDESTRKQIVSAGAVPLLLEAALEANSAQPNAVGTLANLATESDIKLIIVSKYQGLKPILSLLRSEDATVKAHACRALFAIAANDDNKLAIAQAGGLPLLLECMGSSSVAVQINAAGALANLAIHPYNKPKLVEGGALAIMKRMAFSESDKVQRQVARCLFALAAHTENRKHIVESGCISALAYMLCIQKEEVQRNAAGALGNVAMSDEFKAAVVDSGALKPLIMLSLSNSESVKRQTARTIFTLSAKEEIKARIIEEKGLPNIIRLACSTSPEIQRDASGALANLAIGSENKDLVIKCGGLEPLLNLLRSDQSQVQRQSARAIFALAGSNENQIEIIKGGGVPPLVNLLANGHDEVKKHAAGAIANLASNYPKECAGAIPILLESLQCSNLEVRRQSSRAIINICPEDAGVALSVSRYVGQNGEKQRLRHDMRELYRETCIPSYSFGKEEEKEAVVIPTFYDLKLVLRNNVAVPCHSAIVTARSTVLKKMIDLTTLSSKAYRTSIVTKIYLDWELSHPILLESLLEYLYTDSIKINSSRLKSAELKGELLLLAQRLQLPRLEGLMSGIKRPSSWCYDFEAFSSGINYGDITIYPTAAQKCRKLSPTRKTDATIGCRVNRCVLLARSSYFKALFSHPWKDASSGVLHLDCAPNILQFVICYIYGLHLPTLGEEDWLQVLEAASQLNLTGLARLAESSIVATATDLYNIAAHLPFVDAPILKLYVIYNILVNDLDIYVEGLDKFKHKWF